MIFEGLKSKMGYFRGLFDHKLTPGVYTLIMIDGHNFSRRVKNKFKKPFDPQFIGYMNEVAIRICQEFQGIRLAYTQSDEISFLMTDFDGDKISESAYGYRMCKLQSLIAAEASGYFNYLITKDLLETPCSPEDLKEMFLDTFKAGPFTFDCKVWQVPRKGDVNGWFVFRQNDCIINSVSQVAQCNFSHTQLMNLTTSQVKEKLQVEKGISWDSDFPGGMKYGRLIYKEDVIKYTPTGEPFTRGVWVSHDVTEKFTDTGIIKQFIPSNE